jgi:hypothetical protein
MRFVLGDIWRQSPNSGTYRRDLAVFWYNPKHLYRDFVVICDERNREILYRMCLKLLTKKLLELTGKIKALNLAIKKSDEVIDSSKTEVLTQQISSITNQIQATVYMP